MKTPLSASSTGNVTIIGPVWPYRGGIAHHTPLLANAITQAGFSVRVISFRRLYPLWLYPGATDKDNSQSVQKTPAEALLDILSPISWIKTAGAISQTAPDFVVFQWWTTGWALPYAIMGRILHQHGIRQVYLIHNVLPHEEKPWDKHLAGLALTGADDFIVHTPVEEGRLLPFIRPNSRVFIAPLPAYRLFPHDEIDQLEAKHIIGLPAKTPVLLFFGFVRPYKGLGLLLDALELLKDQGIEIHLLVAGEFWNDKAAYLAKINDHGLNDRVTIVDRYIPNEALSLYFAAADAVVTPYESGATQSAVAGLAIGSGKPLIASDLVTQGLLPQHQAQTLTFHHGSLEGLTQTIKSFLEQPAVSTEPPRSTHQDEANAALIEIFSQIIQTKPGSG